MKRKTWVVLMIAVMLVCALSLLACQDVPSGTEHSHTYVDYEYNNDATCGVDGTETAKCKYCDETDTRPSTAHPATGNHSFTAYEYNNDATCVKGGTETATCETCDETDTRPNAAHPATGVHKFTTYEYNHDAT